MRFLRGKKRKIGGEEEKIDVVLPLQHRYTLS
jgi:hypothetical protein